MAVMVGVLVLPAVVPEVLPSRSIEGWLEKLVWSWTYWDGAWYIRIAQEGYARPEANAFYPLFPHLVRWLGYVLGAGQPLITAYQIAGLLISTLSALATCLLLYRLVESEYNRDTAGISVAMLLAFPTSLFLATVYTESLFLALALGAFLAARKQRWLLALALAALAILTKNQGLFVTLALLVEFFHQKGRDWKKPDGRLLYFGLPALALGGWVAYNWYSFGNPLSFLSESQKFWKREFSWPWETLLKSTGDFSYKISDRKLWFPPSQIQSDLFILNVPLIYLFLVLLVLAVWMTWKCRMRPAYTVYFFFCFIQPLFAPAQDDYLYSVSRFLLIIFPAFIIMALAGQRSRWFKQAYFAFSLPILGLLVARFVLGYWVA
jgi:hypothetical protein